MINSALRLARFERLANFLADVGAILDALAEDKTIKSRLSRLRNYSLSITAAKSDDVLRPLAEICEKILELITDGQEFTNEKLQKLRELHAEIGRMVSDDGV
jgi:hypothetical protein